MVVPFEASSSSLFNDRTARRKEMRAVRTQ